jgi:hypothetical protein
MKKTFLLICLAAGLLSCTKEMTPQEEAPAGVPMTFEISVAGTKAAKTDWENGDEVYVFLSGIDNKYLKLSYDIATQTWEVSECGGSFTSTDFETMFENTLTAVYNPRICDIVIEDDYFAILDEKMKPIFNYYLAQTRVPFTVDGTTVEASITLEKPENFVQFHIADIEDAVNNYTLASPQVRPVALKGVRPDGTLLTEIQQAGARLSGFADEDGAIFAGRLVNPDATAYAFSLSYKDPTPANDKIYTLERNSKLTAGKRYNFPVPGEGKWTTTLASDLYVEMGPENKWAKCNLDAAAPHLSGAYYAWGELQPKSRYADGNYLFDPAGSNPKYYDGEATLEKIDDAAYAALGGRFRMPTNWEFMRLLDPSNCSWTWETDYNGTGVSGWLVTSIQRGYSDNKIFFPAAGYQKDNTRIDYNSFGGYWTSTVLDSGKADCLTFTQGTKTMNGGINRAYGLVIRPIYDPFL